MRILGGFGRKILNAKGAKVKCKVTQRKKQKTNAVDAESAAVRGGSVGKPTMIDGDDI